MAQPVIPEIKLNNGATMPQLGLGVWKADDTEAEAAVKTALQTGYRLIDTATLYKNEAGVGRAIQASLVPRDQIFVTTKLWNTDQGFERAQAAFETSLAQLGLDYVDLYLIHWPVPEQNLYIESWRALEAIYTSGRAKAIGVSNFSPAELDKLLLNAHVVPAINQIELHPYHQQRKTRDYCRAHGIQVESWSPLRRGAELLDDPLITRLATAHGKTPAQIVLRWHVQHQLVVIPKSVHAERIRENCDVFDFALSDADMQAIDALDHN